ncbi:inducible T-cell costimulator [Aquarana catesbeiana]|uniref:inducible T-cell costimulator n=1 Tax=Aquarana catesbeiana TaxID=8400 RepID=UPI003CC99B69
MKIFRKNQCLLAFILQVFVQTPVNTTSQVLVVSREGTVDLCKNELIENSRFNLTLEKGNEREVVCQVYTSNEVKKKNPDSWKDVQCHYKEFNGTLFFTLTNLDVKYTDNYTCRMQIFFPPPFKTDLTETYVYVHDYSSYNLKASDCDLSNFPIWILSGIASLFFLCCIIMVYITIQRKDCKECKARTTELSKENNSEYMHMAAVPLVRPPLC